MNIRSFVSRLSIIAIMAFIDLLAADLQARTSNSARERDYLETYARATRLLAAPNTVDLKKVSLLYRAVVTVSEIYESLSAECVEFSGTEGSEVRIRYSTMLGRELFKGKSQPGFEGVHVKILKWKDSKDVICKVGDDYYLVTFDPDPSKIKVSLSEEAR